jgi:membrane protein involved in colicin uptake
LAATVLTILGDATGARRAIADTREDYRRGVDAMGVAARRAAAERRRIEADEIRDTRRVLRAQHQERVRALRDRQRAEEAAARQRQRAAQAEVVAATKAEKDKTKAADRESKLRQQFAAREAAEKARQSRREVTEAARAEREKTREAEREERRRTRLAEDEARKRARAQSRAARDRRGRLNQAGGALVAGGRAVAEFGQDIHGQIQGARERGADVQGGVIEAVSQVGVTNLAEVNRYVAMIRARAIQEGMRSEDFTGAIAAAQTEFSTLGAMERYGGAGGADARRDVFQRAIDVAARGRNMGVNPGEFSRLMGMLNGQGLDANTQDFLAAWTVGAQNRGAVETGAVTREAIGPIMQRMQAAISAAGGDPAARSRAARDAYMQSFAEIQVLRGAGESARLSGNAMAGFNRALSNPGTHAKMRENVSHIQDSALRGRVRSALFDERGALRAENRNPLMFTAAAMNAGLTDPTQLANVFAGTGAGNPMSLQANFRRMMLGLAGRDAEGKTGLDRARALQDANIALSPDRQAALRELYRNSDRSQLNRNEETREKALTDNTSALVNLSNNLANWSARTPFGSAALSAGGSLLGGLATGSGVGQLLGRIPGGGGGPGVLLRSVASRFSAGVARARSALPGMPALSGLGARLAGGAAALSELLRPSNVEGLSGRVGFEDDAAMIRAHTRGGGVQAAMQALQESRRATSVSQVAADGRVLQQAVREGIREGLAGANLRANVDPHTAQHLASQTGPRSTP